MESGIFSMVSRCVKVLRSGSIHGIGHFLDGFQAMVSKQVSTETACCNSARNSKTQVRTRWYATWYAWKARFIRGSQKAPMRIRMGGMPTLTRAEINNGRLLGIRFSL